MKKKIKGRNTSLFILIYFPNLLIQFIHFNKDDDRNGVVCLCPLAIWRIYNITPERKLRSLYRSLPAQLLWYTCKTHVEFIIMLYHYRMRKSFQTTYAYQKITQIVIIYYIYIIVYLKRKSIILS